MSKNISPEEKWVLYFYGFGVCNAVACEDTPEALMPKAGIGQPVQWTDQNGRYLGLPLNGDRTLGFHYTINQDGERLYKIMSGQMRRRTLGERFLNWLRI